jgi:glutamine amidotransferase-like uncharacterized protein
MPCVHLVEIDEADLWKANEQCKGYKKLLQDFVSNGGHYMGFCLGAYLAGPSVFGSDTGFGLLPKGVSTGSEIQQNDSQVDTAEDTVIRVDWTFSSDSTTNGTWVYFQEGAFVKGLDGHNGKVLGRYTESGDVAASVTKYGRGTVGLVGFHPEADESWCMSFLDRLLFLLTMRQTTTRSSRILTG